MIVRCFSSARAEGFSPHRRGMSLLEVLLSLTIFLLAIVAIGRLVDMGTDNALDAQSQAIGTRLAQTKLAEIEAGAIPVDAMSSGIFDVEPEWQWVVDPAPTGIPNLYSVTVEVSRRFRNRTVRVTLSQMICDPRMMGQASEAQKPSTGGIGR